MDRIARSARAHLDLVEQINGGQAVFIDEAGDRPRDRRQRGANREANIGFNQRNHNDDNWPFFGCRMIEIDEPNMYQDMPRAIHEADVFRRDIHEVIKVKISTGGSQPIAELKAVTMF